MTNAQTDYQIGHTLLAQLGNRALFMMGARDIVVTERGAMFRIMGSNAANKLVITLGGDDLYTVEAWKGRGLNWRKANALDGVHVESLHTVIETMTGLYLSFGKR